MKWPTTLYVVWSPGMRPWACLNHESALAHAAFCRENGHLDLEIQQYVLSRERLEKYPSEKLLTPESQNAKNIESKTHKAPSKGRGTKKGENSNG